MNLNSNLGFKTGTRKNSGIIVLIVSVFLACIMMAAGFLLLFGSTERFTISYHTEFGVAPSDRLETSILDDHLQPIEATGYTFVGWYLDSDKTILAEEGALLNDVTLYAKWLKVNNTFNPGEGETTIVTENSGVIENVTPIISTTGEELQTALLQLANAESLDRVKGLEEINSAYEWSENAQLYTAFDLQVDTGLDILQSCEVTLDIDDATVGNELIVLHYNTYINEWEVCSYTRANNKITIDFPNGLSPVAFYLNATQTYTLTYYVNGASYIVQNYEEGETIVLPANPEQENTIFDYWCDSADLTNQYTFTTMPNQAVNVYAKFLSAEETPFRTYAERKLGGCYESATGFYTNVFNGEGQEDNPFRLEHAYDLAMLAILSNADQKYATDGYFKTAYYSLIGDIDAGNDTFETAIGTVDNAFGGTIYGNGYAVKNLTSTTNGLFGYINGANIDGLHITNLNQNYNSEDSDGVGGLVGNAVNSTIKYVYVTGLVNAPSASYVGGIVGKATMTPISNSINKANVVAQNIVGGIAGSVSSAMVRNVSNLGVIEGFEKVAGLVSQLDANSKLYTSYNAMYVNGTLLVGGLVSNNAGIIINCFNTGKVNFEGLESSKVAGIAADNTGSVKTCYSFGDIESTNETDMTFNPICNGTAPLDCYYNMTAFVSGPSRVYYAYANTPFDEQPMKDMLTGCSLLFNDTDRNSRDNTSQAKYISNLKVESTYYVNVNTPDTIWWFYDGSSPEVAWDTTQMTFDGSLPSFVGSDVTSLKVQYFVDSKIYLTKFYQPGDNVVIIEEPTKLGYTFGGWKIYGSDATDFQIGGSDVEVHGVFTINQYEINYILDGEPYTTSYVEYKSTIVYITPEEVFGHTFSGWCTDEACETSAIYVTMPAENLTLYGKNNINKHFVKYYVDNVLTYTDEFAYNQTIDKREDLVREGFTFSGWTTIPNTMGDRDIRVDGSFTINSYLVNIYIDDEFFESKEFVFGSAIVYPTPIKTGYAFDGWYDSTPKNTAEKLALHEMKMPAEELNLYCWFSKQQYSFILYVDGEEFFNDTYYYEDALPTITVPTEEGYHFSGWDIGTLPTTMPANNIIAYGNIIEDVYTIYYNGNGGTVSVAEQRVAFGTILSKPVDPTKHGLSFDGWYLDPECTDQNKFSFLTTMPANDIYLYAKWVAPSLSSVGLLYELYTDPEDNITKYGIRGVDAGYSGPLVIVGTKDSYVVGKIYENAFANNTSITSLVIYGVKTIQENAFKGCSNLDSVILGTGVEEIKAGAFENCGDVTYLDIGADVKFIGANAFKNCSTIQTLTYGAVNCGDIEENLYPFELNNLENGVDIIITEQVEQIPARLFCTVGKLKITSITFQGSNTTTIGAYAFKNMAGMAVVNLPECITTINEGAFQSTSLISFTFPENVTVVADRVLSDNAGLVSVSLNDNITTIGNYAFANCVILSSIDLLNVQEIGQYAFDNCKLLTSIVLPNTITTLGGRAFINCSKLANITFSTNPSFTTLPIELFKNCPSIITITLTDNITTVGEGVFDNCSNLVAFSANSVTSLGNYVFNRCRSLTTFDCDTVQSVGKSAFFSCTKLASISLPEATFYGDYAFGSCTSLTSFTFSSFATQTGAYMLSKCSKITSITVPANILIIGEGTFQDCSTLATINLHDNITDIGGYAFSGCEVLTTLDIPSKITEIKLYTFNGCKVINNLVVPESVTKFGDYAFSGCEALQSINFPTNLTVIGPYAFNNCLTLANIDNSNKIETIANYAFQNCKEITHFEMSDSVVSAGEGIFKGCIKLESVTLSNNLINLGAQAFSGCVLLSEITIPDLVVEVPDYCFSNCTALTTVSIGKSVTKIGSRAFERCAAIAYCVIPSKITDIATNAFANCDKNMVVYYEGAYSTLFSGFNIKYYYENQENPELPPCENNNYFDYWHYVEGEPKVWGADAIVSRISYKSRFGAIPTELVLPWITNPALTTITANESFSLTFDGWYYDDKFVARAQAGDYLLEEKTVLYAKWNMVSSAELTYKGYDSNDVETDNDANISYYAVSGYEGQDEVVVIPASHNGKLVTKIDESAFSGKTAISKVVFESIDFDTIGDHAFQNCYNLETIVLPYYLKTIGEEAFAACISMTNLVATKGTTTIKSRAFSNCSGLRTAELSSDVVTLGEGIFENCSQLQMATLPNSFAENPFTNCNSLFSLTLKEGLNNTIIPGVIPATIKQLVVEKITRIEDNAFSGCSSLLTIRVDSGLVEIGNSAFKNCSSLATVQFPDTLTTVGEQAFASCLRLNNISLPGIVTLGASAFKGCSFLTTVALGNGLTVIEESVFEGCATLSNITVSSNLTRIKRDAFKGSGKIVAGISTVFDANNETEYLINVDSSIQSITSQDLERVRLIADYTFYNNTTIQSVVLSNAVRYLGAYTFYSCSNLTMLDAGNSLVQEIEEYTMYHCDKLSTFKLPATVTNINKTSFIGCTLLSDFDTGANEKYHDDGDIVYERTGDNLSVFMYLQHSGNATVIIPEIVTVNGTPLVVNIIQDQAFANAVALKKVVAGGLVRVVDGAFTGCVGLNIGTVDFTQGLYIQNSSLVSISGAQATLVKQLDYESVSIVVAGELQTANITTIATGAFENNTKVQTIELSNTITTISSGAFANLTNLVSLSSNGSATINFDSFTGTKLNTYPLTNAESLGYTHVGQAGYSYELTGYGIYEVNETVSTAILMASFDGSHSEVTVENLTKAKTYQTTIGSYAFKANTAVTRVNLGVSGISANAFDGCTKLTAVNALTNITITQLSSLTGIQIDLSRVESSEAYIIAGKFLLVGNKVVRYLDAVSTDAVVIPNSYTAIGEYAFMDSRMTAINLGSVTSISNYALTNCLGLTELVIPANAELGSNIILSSTNIAYVILNENVSSSTPLETFEGFDKTIYATSKSVIWTDSEEFTLSDGSTAYIVENCKFYSETEPSEEMSQHWYYNNGVPTVWTKNFSYKNKNFVAKDYMSLSADGSVVAYVVEINYSNYLFLIGNGAITGFNDYKDNYIVRFYQLSNMYDSYYNVIIDSGITSIGNYILDENVYTIFSAHTQAAWASVEIAANNYTGEVYYYSDTTPEADPEYYWYFDAINKEPIWWE